MKKAHILLFVSVFCSVGIFGQTKKEKKAQKEALEMESFNTMIRLVESKEFQFEATWALGQYGKRINLISNPNFIKVKGDSIYAYLPYFGVSQGAAGAYDGGGAIDVENVMYNFSIKKNEKKKKIIIKLSAKGKIDQNDFIITVFASGNGSVNVMSSSRSNITYDGTFTPISENKTGKDKEE